MKFPENRYKNKDSHALRHRNVAAIELQRLAIAAQMLIALISAPTHDDCRNRLEHDFDIGPNALLIDILQIELDPT